MKLMAKHHEQMNDLIGKILDAHKADTVSRDTAIGAVAHVITAAAIGNASEVSSWLSNPATFENWLATASDQIP